MIIYDNSFGNNTPYAVGNSVEEVAQEFENPSKILFKCFSENQMKTNPDKFYFLSSLNSAIGRSVEHEKIASSKFENY